MPVQWTMRRWVVICPIPSVLVMCVKLNGNRTCHENCILQLNRPDFHAKLCPSLFKYSSTVCRLHKLRSETELSCRPLHMEIILFGSLVIIEWNGVTESWCVCFNQIPAACLSFRTHISTFHNPDKYPVAHPGRPLSTSFMCVSGIYQSL